MLLCLPDMNLILHLMRNVSFSQVHELQCCEALWKMMNRYETIDLQFIAKFSYNLYLNTTIQKFMVDGHHTTNSGYRIFCKEQQESIEN